MTKNMEHEIINNILQLSRDVIALVFFNGLVTVAIQVYFVRILVKIK